MTASTQEPKPAPQPPQVLAPQRGPHPSPHAVVTHDAPHEEHPHDEPGYGHGV